MKFIHFGPNRNQFSQMDYVCSKEEIAEMYSKKPCPNNPAILSSDSRFLDDRKHVIRVAADKRFTTTHSYDRS